MGLNHQIPKRKGQLWKTSENSGETSVLRLPRKKEMPKTLRLLEILRNPWKNQRFQQPGRQVPGREAMRPPAARPGITVPYHENHWKMNAFAHPGRWNTVHSAESLCETSEILRLLENLQNHRENMVPGP